MVAQMDDNQANVLEEALTRFMRACSGGEQPDIEEFIGQYPQCKAQLKRRIQDLQEIDSLFDSLVQADEIEFAATVTGHDLVGRKIGSFEIVELIGRGGMGVVYLARDTRLKRSVAIKSMSVELRSDSTTRTRFRREAELLASLNHPNIAAIYEIIEQEEDTSYLVLEYVPGQTLAQRIAHKPLRLDEALSIGQQVAEAVSAAHDKGVVHRDLKPGNVKITPKDKVKVLDFGLAKVSSTEVESTETGVTQPGRVIGTPAYMSPEQARGKSTDHRTDIWSFGCIMYEMLTGNVPFEGETATDTVARILEREPDWQALAQETPTNIQTLLRRCLEKDPRLRLRDIGDAVIEISETLNMPVTTPPMTTPSSTSLTPQITTRHKLRTAVTIVAASVIVMTIIAVQLVSKRGVPPSSKEIRLVVLPFENLGSIEDEYFADGITEEIMSRLSAIHTLGVISRTSAVQYKNSRKTIRRIGEELGVEYVLEGTVRWERPSEGPSRVRITPQLIRISDDTHLWSERYDAVFADIFQVQSGIAERVAQALDITLLEPQRRALTSRPTKNMEAYDYYLRGNEYSQRSLLESDKRIAIQMYEKAIELDPTFALAYAQLSRAHVLMYWFYYDRNDARLALGKQAVDRALELNPNLPEAHWALGQYYYHGHLDYDRALKQFATGRKILPNNTGLLSYIGYVQRRQGKFEQALANFKRASELNPLSHISAWDVGTTSMYLRKYPEAERYCDQAIPLAPDLSFAYYCKGWLYLCWEGSTEKARAILEEALQSIRSAETPRILNLLVNIDVFDGNYQEALDRLSLKSQDIDNQDYVDDVEYFIPNALLYARIYGYMNKTELARKYYDEARSILESKINERPEHARFHSVLGIAYAGLGRKEDALREGMRGVELLPVSKETMRGPCRVEDLARIYVMVGEFDEAIDLLEFLLAVPGKVSKHILRLDPVWDPVRNHPRFKKLIEQGK
jgi:serine/threonine protein kinase/tetratricopeptide (TPR) repeat protein